MVIYCIFFEQRVRRLGQGLLGVGLRLFPATGKDPIRSRGVSGTIALLGANNVTPELVASSSVLVSLLSQSTPTRLDEVI